MKHFRAVFAFLFVFAASCSKEYRCDPPVGEEEPDPTAPAASTIYNPIVGKWELGQFKSVCINTTDTLVFPNERGDFVEFARTDTAYYTYNTTNATGRSPYKIIDSATFFMGDTMRIIHNDGVRLTTFCKRSEGSAYEWMTYKKVSGK